MRFAPQTRTRETRRHGVAVASTMVALVLMLFSCTDWYAPDLNVSPTGLEATDNLASRIEIDWDDYPSQVLYLVYRSEIEEGPFDTPVAYTTASAYVDTDVGIAPYYYRVRAADPTDTSRTSPLSETVAGTVDARDAEWQGAQTSAAGVSAIHFTVDATGTRYMATVADAVDAAPTLRRYDAETGAWTVPADPAGAVVDGTTRPIAAAVDDVPYLFFTDAARSGRLSVYALNEDAPEGEEPTMDTVEASLLSAGPVSWLSATPSTLGAVVAWVENVDDDGLGEIRAAVAQDGSVTTISSPAASEAAPVLSSIENGVLLASFDGKEGAAGVIRVRAYNGTAWSPVATQAVAAPGLIHTSLVIAAESEDRFWLAYVEADGPSHVVYEYNDGSWDDHSPATSTAPVFGSGSRPALDFQAGAVERPYLFFRSGDDGRGIVLRRTEDSGVNWNTISPEEFTENANVGNLFLRAVEGYVYAAYTEAAAFGGANARTRFFE